MLLSALVLLLSSVASGRPEGADTRLAYLDEVRPIVERSNQQGDDLREVRERAIELGRPGIGRRLARVQDDARRGLEQVAALEEPEALRLAHAYLIATLGARADAAASTQRALEAALGTDPAPAAVRDLVEAGERMATADRTYELFRDAVPSSVGDVADLPDSAWLAAGDDWSEPEATALVATLRASTALSPVHDLAVIAVTTEPPAVGREPSGAATLPPERTLRVRVVVGNVGNEPQEGVTVSATVTDPGGATDSARDFVDLQPGQRVAMTLGGLRPVLGVESTLAVTVGPAEGETQIADNTQSMRIFVRAE